MEDMDLKKRHPVTDTRGKTYRMTPDAHNAVETLCVAMKLPRSKIMELAVLRLMEEWRAGKVKNVGVVLTADFIADG